MEKNTREDRLVMKALQCDTSIDVLPTEKVKAPVMIDVLEYSKKQLGMVAIARWEKIPP